MNTQVFAVVTASLAAVTALLYLIPIVVRTPFLFVWDTILFILWIALFGLFGNMYIKEDAEGNKGIKRMKNAVVCFLFSLSTSSCALEGTGSGEVIEKVYANKGV